MAARPDIAADAARIARLALDEDGPRDVTSDASILPAQHGTAIIEARSDVTVAGCAYADAVADACGLPAITWRASDGDQVKAGDSLGTLRGPLAAILRAERPLLNILQRACGIATLTRRYVNAVAGTGCVVLHTRKTTPGLRLLEVAAVVAGGGGIHRLDLAHAVMVKDNHWQAIRRSHRSLADVLADARSRGVAELCVEVESLEQLHDACNAAATRLLIDNQGIETVRAWAIVARQLRPGIAIEATGGITLQTVREFALAAGDYVSVGALTHSVPAADIALEIGDIEGGSPPR